MGLADGTAFNSAQFLNHGNISVPRSFKRLGTRPFLCTCPCQLELHVAVALLHTGLRRSPLSHREIKFNTSGDAGVKEDQEQTSRAKVGTSRGKHNEHTMKKGHR